MKESLLENYLDNTGGNKYAKHNWPNYEVWRRAVG